MAMSDAPARDTDNAQSDTETVAAHSGGEGERKLREALRSARIVEADRSDVIVAIRDGETARLELLREELADVFAAIPEDADLLACEILPGNPPRLWIDVLAYVVMGNDKRTYRFLRSARNGRQVLLETANIQDVAARITQYVAHRLIERERALASDELIETPIAAATQPLSDAPAAPVEADEDKETQQRKPDSSDTPAPSQSVAPNDTSRGARVWSPVVGFLLGILAGAGGLLAVGYVLINQ
ncbi:MAG: hypothetical protein AAFX39_08270 [Pseudomonadota bacterium]